MKKRDFLQGAQSPRGPAEMQGPQNGRARFKTHPPGAPRLPRGGSPPRGNCLETGPRPKWGLRLRIRAGTAGAHFWGGAPHSLFNPPNPPQPLGAACSQDIHRAPWGEGMGLASQKQHYLGLIVPPSPRRLPGKDSGRFLLGLFQAAFFSCPDSVVDVSLNTGLA